MRRAIDEIYTRQDAIADGVLIDVSNTSEAKEAGFRIPVCITAGVHALCQVPAGLEGIQDYNGRLWDTLYMAALAVKRVRSKTNDDVRRLSFGVAYAMNRVGKPKTHKLWLVFNEYEGFTIMLPSEY